jgi:hypothetical protein
MASSFAGYIVAALNHYLVIDNFYSFSKPAYSLQPALSIASSVPVRFHAISSDSQLVFFGLKRVIRISGGNATAAKGVEKRAHTKHKTGTDLNAHERDALINRLSTCICS